MGVGRNWRAVSKRRLTEFDMWKWRRPESVTCVHSSREGNTRPGVSNVLRRNATLSEEVWLQGCSRGRRVRQDVASLSWMDTYV